MAHLVLGDRSFLSWHIKQRAELEGITVKMADPQDYLAAMPSEEDVELVFDDELADTPAETSAETSTDPSADGTAEEDTEDEPEGALSAEDQQRQRVIEAMMKARESEKSTLSHVVYLADTRLWNPTNGTMPSDEELAQQIRDNTEALINILEQLPTAPDHLVLATSINAGNSTPVGQALAETSVLLEEATSDYTTRFVELQFPNIFGEGCPTHKSSLISQLARAIAAGKSPRVSQNRPMTIMYAQEVARVLLQPMPDFALPTAESHKESTAEFAILMNEAAGIIKDGRLPARISPDQYGLLFELYSTLRASQIAQDDDGAELNTLGTDVITYRLPTVSSRIRLATKDKPLTFTSSLGGLHRLVVLSGSATIKIGEKSYKTTAEIDMEEGTGLPFIDLPHGYDVTVNPHSELAESLVGDAASCLVGEWISEV
ncbi:MAG: hypothetical protein WAN89_06315 [Lawsonella sp.]